MKHTKKQRKGEGESSYTKRQRRRAEAIIKATGCYSAAFRAEVQDALNRLPHKLPTLFREAEKIDSRLETAGREIRMRCQNAGMPLGEGRSRTMQRSPKRFIQRLSDEVESVMIQHEAEQLTEEMAERAQIISDILFDIGNEAGVSATHPTIIKGYIQAVYDCIFELEGRDREYVQRAFEHIQDLLNGCSEERYEHIRTMWESGDPHASQEARRKEFPHWDLATPDLSEKEKANEYDRIYKEAEQARDEVEREQAVDDCAGGADPDPQMERIRQKLRRLEDLPENEAIAFKLETELYKLERENEATAEWPDLIGDGGNHAAN